jgi:hypothetical protein
VKTEVISNPELRAFEPGGGGGGEEGWRGKHLLQKCLGLILLSFSWQGLSPVHVSCCSTDKPDNNKQHQQGSIQLRLLDYVKNLHLLFKSHSFCPNPNFSMFYFMKK